MFIRIKLFNFNSHAHVERDADEAVELGLIDDFNSHAHVERDINAEAGQADKAISTHTLTWSVTITTNCKIGFFPISTHTLTWSVTTQTKLNFKKL